MAISLQPPLNPHRSTRRAETVHCGLRHACSHRHPHVGPHPGTDGTAGPHSVGAVPGRDPADARTHVPGHSMRGSDSEVGK
jgi:hypothetical protein